MPSLLGVAIFYVIPYLDVLRRSFMTSSGVRFAGMDNFVKVAENPAFHLAIRNSFLFMAICIPLLLAISLGVALVIYDNTRIGAYIKTGLLLPMAIPVAAVVVVWRVLFDNSGLLNAMMNYVGADAVDWMNSNHAFAVLIISYIWKNLGYNVVLWLAGLSIIPVSLYEAAQLDRAGWWATFIHITIPEIKPMAAIISVLAIINSFKVFREAYLVAGDYPHESMYMVQHLFNNWFRDLALDKMAAGAVLISIVLIFLVFVLQRAWGDINEK